VDGVISGMNGVSHCDSCIFRANMAALCCGCLCKSAIMTAFFLCGNQYWAWHKNS
jgi:hypothetical protein